MRKIEDDAVRAIKAAGAHHCLVWTRGESEPRKVAISDRRNKWQQLEAVLSQLDWTRIDACDKSGATLHTIIAEDEPPPPQSHASTSGALVPSSLMYDFAKLLQQSVRETAETHARQYAATLQGYERLFQTLGESFGTLQAITRETLALQRQGFQAQAGAAGAGDDDPDGDGILKTVLQLAQLQQMAQAAKAAQAPKPPTNGATGPAKPSAPPPPPPPDKK